MQPSNTVSVAVECTFIPLHWPGCLTALSEVKTIGLPLVPCAFNLPSTNRPTFPFVNWTVMPGSGVSVTPLFTNRSEETV